MSTIDHWTEKWAELENQLGTIPTKGEPRHFRPLADATDDFIREAHATHRIYTGIPEFDEQMRGVSDGHFCLVVGYNHSGKTLWYLHVLRHNADKRVIWYIPDEPQTLVLTKLATLSSGIPARQIEEAVRANDTDMIRMLRNVALEEFPNLIVYDKPLNGAEMMRAYDEACDHWGDKPDMVAFDYLELLPQGETVQAKADWLKSFGAINEVPMFVLHQTSRSAGAEGRKMTISSGAYGGEQHATFLIGVRRKLWSLKAELDDLIVKRERSGPSEALNERIESLRCDMEIHEFTLTASLLKNKRPGGGLVDDIDFELETATGRLYPLGVGDLPKQYRAKAEAARRGREAEVRFLDDEHEYEQHEMSF